MKTNIIINPNSDPFIPKGLVVSKHQKMPISTFYPDFFRFMELEEIEGPFIGHEGYMSMNAILLDHFLAHPEDIPKKLKLGRSPIYFMDTIYNREEENSEAWQNVRCMIYDEEEKICKEGSTHLYHQEFYSGFALLYNMEQHTVYEMEKLSQHQGKIVKVLFTEPPERNPIKKYWPDGYVGSLSAVDAWKGVYFEKKIQFGSSHAAFVFIGADMGITKITLEETGEVLYENSELSYPPNIGWEKMLTHMNEMRELKYGTNKYNASEL